MPRRGTRPETETRHAPNVADRREEVREKIRDSGPGYEEISRQRAEIARLLPLWPNELADMSQTGSARILAVLERALRAERRRGLAGHWTYNLSRHAQLLHAYRVLKAAARTNETVARRCSEKRHENAGDTLRTAMHASSECEG